jgi:hypothetical protein
MSVVFVIYKCNRNTIMKTLIWGSTWKNYVKMENRIKINKTAIACESVDWVPLAKNSARQLAS